jgi:hypothetical protein
MFEFMSGPNQLNVQSYNDGIKLVREKKGNCFAPYFISVSLVILEKIISPCSPT